MKEDNLLFNISEIIARSNPKVAVVLDNNKRIVNNLERRQFENSRRLEQEKSERIITFYNRLMKLFVATAINERKRFIEIQEGEISQKKIEAKLKKQYPLIKEFEDQLAILIELYPLVEKIPFAKEKSEKATDETNPLSFNLISEASSGLNDLRKTLMEKKLIKEISASNFKSVFYTDVQTIIIDWNRWGELRYFVKKMSEQHSIFKEHPKDSLMILAGCFSVDGSRKTNKQLNNTHLTTKQASKNIIDEAIQALVESCKLTKN
jgi:hypothetical protein